MFCGTLVCVYLIPFSPLFPFPLRSDIFSCCFLFCSALISLQAYEWYEIAPLHIHTLIFIISLDECVCVCMCLSESSSVYLCVWGLLYASLLFSRYMNAIFLFWCSRFWVRISASNSYIRCSDSRIAIVDCCPRQHQHHHHHHRPVRSLVFMYKYLIIIWMCWKCCYFCCSRHMYILFFELWRSYNSAK